METLVTKIFAEVGIGNDTFLSTEYEEGDNEYRVPKLIFPDTVTEFYIRIWVFKTVFIFSTKNLFEIKKKKRNTLKILFGVGGTQNH